MLFRSVVGAVILPMAFLPSAAWGSTIADSVPIANDSSSPELTATDSPEPTATDSPEPTATETTEPATTATTTATSTTTARPGSGPENLGTLGITPVSGVPGTKITVKSVTSCVDARGKVGKGALAVLISDQEDAEPLDAVFVATGKGGSWTAKLTVPKAAKSGDVYWVTGACFSRVPKEQGPSEEEPFTVYQPAEFKVTGAGKAPVATPVTKSPTFTG
jgi:hypothetical protein